MEKHKKYLPFCLALIGFAAAGHGATPLPPEIKKRLGNITEARLKSHVKALADIGPRHWLDQAATVKTIDYIKKELRQYGYAPVEERFSFAPAKRDEAGRPLFQFGKDGQHVNILAELRGVEQPAAVIEAGAHYDSVPGTPGADDNASGVAGLLEIARVMAGGKFRKTVRFCFFAMEEAGLIGSQAHVKNLQAKPKEKVEGAIVFEMIGYATELPNSQKLPEFPPAMRPLIERLHIPTRGDFIAVIGNAAAVEICRRFETATARYVPALKRLDASGVVHLFPDAYRSDHASYWEKGYPAIMLTDTANFRNPNYHRSSDTPGTLNYGFLRQVTRAAAATLLEWADAREQPANHPAVNPGAGGGEAPRWIRKPVKTKARPGSNLKPSESIKSRR